MQSVRACHLLYLPPKHRGMKVNSDSLLALVIFTEAGAWNITCVRQTSSAIELSHDISMTLELVTHHQKPSSEFFGHSILFAWQLWQLWRWNLQLWNGSI